MASWQENHVTREEGTGAQSGSQQVLLQQQPESRLDRKRGGAIGPQGPLQKLASSSEASSPKGSTTLVNSATRDQVSKHVIQHGGGRDFTFKA